MPVATSRPTSRATRTPPTSKTIPPESNPYGLAVLSNGDALVADAANNDLLRITRSGQISTVARFDTEEISTDHLGDPASRLRCRPRRCRPSIAVVGRWAFVGELEGFPFRPGSSRVWKIDTRSNGAVCSANPANATSESSLGDDGLYRHSGPGHQPVDR